MPVFACCSSPISPWPAMLLGAVFMGVGAQASTPARASAAVAADHHPADPDLRPVGPGPCRIRTAGWRRRSSFPVQLALCDGRPRGELARDLAACRGARLAVHCGSRSSSPSAARAFRRGVLQSGSGKINWKGLIGRAPTRSPPCRARSGRFVTRARGGAPNHLTSASHSSRRSPLQKRYLTSDVG